MGRREETREYLKESLADALLGLLEEKPFDEITIDEIVRRSRAGRMTYFRHFQSKQELIRYKIHLLWERYAKEHNLRPQRHFSYDILLTYFQYHYEIRDILRLLHRAGLQDTLFSAFMETMPPPEGEDAAAWYRERFYVCGLYSAMDGWIRRDFAESVEEMAELIRSIRYAD